MLVLVSLLLQIVLIIFGSRRKYTTGKTGLCIRILVWLAYLSADWVATVSLGNLATNGGDFENNSSRLNNITIQAFWAPFLLLHLGGPDTITAYSLEDNELWLRHFLELIVQVLVALYVFVWSWSKTALTFIAIPIFIIAFMKYVERTFVLWSASTSRFKETLISNPLEENAMRIAMATKEEAFFGGDISMEESGKQINELYWSRKQDGNHMQEAYFLFERFKYLFANLILGHTERMDCYNIICKNSAEEAFKLVAIEAGFMYDVLYTKATAIYTQWGIFRRTISFLFSASALIIFFITIDMNTYPLLDIYITYFLLFGAVFLEVYAFIIMLLSDWTKLWFVKFQIPLIDYIPSPLHRCRSLLTNQKRWSECIAQYNLIDCCINDKHGVCICVHKFSYVKESLEYWNMTWENVDGEMQTKIFNQLKEKGDELKNNYNVKRCKEVLAERGDNVLKKDNELHKFSWSIAEKEFDHSLLIWHIATDVCCCLDLDKNRYSVDRKTSKYLSNYMLYLLVLRPSMMPKGIGEIRFRDTCDHLRQFAINKEKEEVCEMLPEKFSRRPINQSVLSDACKLAKNLQSLKLEGKWTMIREVWIEMLAYAANRCGWKEHAQQLRRGGELLTHVSLLMAHFGLSEQYNENERLYFV